MKKYNFLNVWRLVMALLVIMNHLNPFNEILKNHTIIYNLYNFIIPFAVPFFFITTGFFLGKKLENKDNLNNKEDNIILDMIIKLIKIYITFTIIYLPITLYFNIHNEIALNDSIISFLRGTFLIGENFNSWFLWYILSEIYGLTIIYLVRKKSKDNNKLFIIGLLLFILGLCVTTYNKLLLTSETLLKIQSVTIFIMPSGRILNSVIYITLGLLISNNEENNNKYLKFAILAILFILNGFITSNIFSNISILICSYIIFKFIINIDFKNNKIANYCRSLSKDFYFLHLLVFSIIQFIFEHKIENNYRIRYFLITLLILTVLSSIHYLYKTKRQ